MFERGVSRDESMKKLLKAIGAAIDACAAVSVFNPTLANFALRCLAKIATQTGIEEVGK